MATAILHHNNKGCQGNERGDEETPKRCRPTSLGHMVCLFFSFLSHFFFSIILTIFKIWLTRFPTSTTLRQPWHITMTREARKWEGWWGNAQECHSTQVVCFFYILNSFFIVLTTFLDMAYPFSNIYHMFWQQWQGKIAQEMSQTSLGPLASYVYFFLLSLTCLYRYKLKWQLQHGMTATVWQW